ncbi:rRNA maturation RNase YbeY [Halocynthiibacter styelae]|uniref:Endoribonuclease YbeY n=1 Tax=Halocynthiibacter styelae TaxID=2761955 RepID=A0A8J7IY12_9RHOB|nr:rRNA maturation RNase YbeY [Paenihalocynthiibacter styelae]MBI1494275.1 rRNA maturation RNase YbeY [Paenihalocynthiibacter styelae]
MITDVICEDPRWEEAGLEALSETAAQAVFAHLDLTGDWEVVVMGCDDARIAVLNADFRDKDKATNVLSWPSEERAADDAGGQPLSPVGPDPELGDIAISYDTCAREAAEAGKTFTDHVTHLAVHGILHLLGYDHIHDKDAALMEGLETEILGNLGIADPY